MKRINIFVDETGEFGFTKDTSKIYGVSFTFHEHEDNIIKQIQVLNNRLDRAGYTGMIHMADLIAKRNEYASFDIANRKKIFYSIFEFSKRVKIKYKTILIDKSFTDNKKSLKNKLRIEIEQMISSIDDYLNKFDQIVLYYDNGQDDLSTILISILGRYAGFVHKYDFDHVEKRLFQVSDMLTFVDKLQYKYNNKIELSKNERYFFSKDDIRRIIKELDKKRLN